MFFKIVVLKNFAPKKTPVLETLFNKVVGLFCRTRLVAASAGGIEREQCKKLVKTKGVET